MECRCNMVWIRNLKQVFQRSVNSGIVLLYNGVAFFAVSLFNGSFNLRNSFIFWQNVRNCKEASLHNGVNTLSHTGSTSNFNCVNCVQFQVFSQNFFLNFNRKMIPNFISFVRSIQQECSAVFGNAQNINFIHKLELVTSHKICRSNQISRTNRIIGKTQVRCGHRAGFTRIVNKVALTIFAGVFSNDFNRVLVSANGTIGTQTKEHSTYNIVWFNIKFSVISQ